MRLIPCATLALLALSGVALAQSQDTFILFNSPIQQPVGVYEVAGDGSMLATVAQLPTSFAPQSLVMSGDNLSYRVVGYVTSPRTGMVLDVAASGAVTTLASGFPLDAPIGMARDCNGDWLVVNQRVGTQTLEIIRLHGTTLALVSTTQTALYPFAVSKDEDSGQLVVRGQTIVSPYQPGYFRIDPHTGVVTGFAVAQQGQFYPVYGARKPIFDGPTGAFVDMTYDPIQRSITLTRVHPEIGLLPFGFKTTGLPVDLTRAGQRSAPVYYHALIRSATAPLNYSILHLNKNGGPVGSSPVQGITPSFRSTLLRVGSRHLSWRMDNPPNGRSLLLSFPREPRRAYVLGLSLTGPRPGPVLSDGREIPLILDAVTMLCLGGGVPGILEDTVGRLDRNGQARVMVDTNPFGSALKGIRAWAAAVLIDPGAPTGISHIVGPTQLEIRR